jgi:hypothetical protein
MTTFNFYLIGEVALARKEKRNPIASFGITSDNKSVSHYIRKYELEDNYIWIEQ